ncbi:MAG: replication-associated recombination protein A [Deltaproteobacteria bacterium]|nr:replication-associated recombination protein A [Deltaproteobacteria bacterium]
MDDLFSQNLEQYSPLAHRMRPRTLEEFVGQEHLLGPGKFLAQIFQSPQFPSLILWGPPGTGKTTLAGLLASKKGFHFIPLSAVTAGIKDVKEVAIVAENQLKLHGKKTILFLDEIHRFNKAQQDALLPHVEKGTITLVGATTENPSFEVISALLSRAKVLVINRLTEEDLKKISKRALDHLNVTIDPEAETFLCTAVDGDARRMLNTLETAAALKKIPPGPPFSKGGEIKIADIEEALQKQTLLFDKKGEEHYNVISAFIKSMRGSDPDAAVYYLARLLEAGEDPLFVARRMVIFASEDIGNADPQAITLAISTMQSFDFIGMPEGWIPLAQCATYLASAKKGNASYKAYLAAKEDVQKFGSLPVPLHLRNAPTRLMKDLDYGKGYQYAHDMPEGKVTQEHLPEKLAGKKYYERK